MFLYRLILTLLAPPALVLRQLVLALRGRAEPGGIAQRLALSVPRANGPVLWLHAASNGELASARGAVAAILGRHPDLGVVVTTNTLTGRALAESWALPRLTARLAPADTPGAVRRFLDALRPVALVVVENELWPERLARCASRGIPVLVLGARMSAGSSRNWARFRKLAARVIGSLSWLSAQDADSARRFVALGLAETRLGPVINLKAAFAAARQASVLPFPRPDTVLAASTHPGEEAVVLAAFRAARAQNPALRLILAPRHPRRSAEIARLITGAGLAFATRSKGEAPEADTQVYLADTMGEMDLWYAAAGMTFVAGSLSDLGGHTPYEPAAHGSAILHGPDVANSAPAYAALHAAGAAVRVAGTEDLAREILRLADPALQARLAEKARTALGGADPDALAPFLAALDAALCGKTPDVHPART